MQTFLHNSPRDAPQHLQIINRTAEKGTEFDDCVTPRRTPRNYSVGTRKIIEIFHDLTLKIVGSTREKMSGNFSFGPGKIIEIINGVKIVGSTRKKSR
jgi:hypothetical protein